MTQRDAAPNFGFADPVLVASLLGTGLEATQAAGDFNGDGKLDVIASRFYLPFENAGVPVTILTANPDGSYTDSTVFLMPGAPGPAAPIFASRIVTADFNGDGKDDIFIPDQGYINGDLPGRQNLLWLSTGVGSMVDASLNNLPGFLDFSTGASAADMDGDGDIDIFVDNTYASAKTPSYILVNDGTGKFSLGVDVLPKDLSDLNKHQFMSSALADMDQDGDLDLILGSSASANNPSLVVYNDGTGKFTAGTATLPAKPYNGYANARDIAVADLNGDGKPDVVVLYSDPSGQGRFIQINIQNSVSLYVDQTQIRLPQPADDGPADKRIHLADYDGNGAVDILVQSESRPFRLFLNNGQGSFTLSETTVDAFVNLVPGDYNNDGSVDIFGFGTNSSGGGDFYIVPNEGAIRTQIGSESDDEFGGSTGADRLEGRGGRDLMFGREGNDSAYGGVGHDIIYGNSGDDMLYGQRHNDKLYGGAGNDQVFGGQENDTVYGNLDSDAVYGNLGDDNVYGGGGPDALYGGQGDDRLFGGNGEDHLFGSAGNDIMLGMGGGDRFHFASNSGQDIIADFDVNGGDVIHIAKFMNGLGFNSFADVQSRLSVVSGNAVIDFGSGHTVTLVGVDPAALKAEMFAFE